MAKKKVTLTIHGIVPDLPFEERGYRMAQAETAMGLAFKQEGYEKAQKFKYCEYDEKQEKLIYYFEE